MIPVKGTATPLAIRISPDAPEDVTVSSAVIKSTVNPEVAYQVYRGPDIPLSELNAILQPSGGADVTLTGLTLDVDHGVELELTVKGGAADYNGRVIWKLANQAQTPSPGWIKAEREFGPRSWFIGPAAKLEHEWGDPKRSGPPGLGLER